MRTAPVSDGADGDVHELFVGSARDASEASAMTRLTLARDLAADRDSASADVSARPHVRGAQWVLSPRRSLDGQGHRSEQ